MVVKVKESFEKTRQVKSNDKSKKCILRGQRITRYHEKILSNRKKSYKFINFREDYNGYKAENFTANITFDDLSNDVSHFVLAQNFIISTCLSKVLTINFLEVGNRYKVESFSVYLLFNELSNDISHVAVAQNFVISTCLSYVDIQY